ncbi:hypothetical protein ABNX05_10995 [Lysinibacillus sp. M3]|uniref:Uncharacterized protein n=1 Tax=Lysinibacillus zambalensis TaxID=3160866 RepID=A0ABV1MSQ0_9BACI
MQSVIFDVTDETVAKVAKQVKNNKSDSMLVLAPMSGNCSVHAPSKSGKYKGYHRIKLEVWIPEDAIKGENALDDFGLVTMLRLPKSRVQSHLISNNEN